MTEKQPSLYRINLKPGNCKDRKKLIQFCLKDDFEKQYVSSAGVRFTKTIIILNLLIIMDSMTQY